MTAPVPIDPPSTVAPTAPVARAAPVAPAAPVARASRAPIPEFVVALLEGPLGVAIETASGYAGGALSAATLLAYKRSWLAFAAWCRGHGLDPDALPIHPVVAAAYLGSLGETVGRSNLRMRLAAIAYEHDRRGQPWSSNHPNIRQTLRGILRRHGKPVRPAAALTSVEVKRLLDACGPDPGGREGLSGLRDRALFLVGLAGALRRSELVAIDVDHLRFVAQGLVVRIPRSKSDQEGQGADVTIPRMRGADTCPVKAVERWLFRAGITRGAVFRGVTTHGTIEDRLNADGVRKILLRRAKLAGLTVDPTERLSPHGLRAGFVTEAYLAAAPDEQVMAHTRHTDISTMRGYRRRTKITAENPARLLDL